MNVTNSTSSLPANDFQAGKKQFEQSFNKLSNALDSGDIAGAKTAFESLKPKNAPAGAPPQGSENNPMAKAVNTLSTALEKGDLSAAKNAFSNLKTEMANARMHGPQPESAPEEMTGKTTSTLGNNINTVA